MKSVKISLQMAQNVKDFVNIVQEYPYEIDLKSEKYVVDAKSILGIFSLDLSKPVTVEIHSDNCDDLIAALKNLPDLSGGSYDRTKYPLLQKSGFLSVETGASYEGNGHADPRRNVHQQVNSFVRLR